MVAKENEYSLFITTLLYIWTTDPKATYYLVYVPTSITICTQPLYLTNTWARPSLFDEVTKGTIDKCLLNCTTHLALLFLEQDKPPVSTLSTVPMKITYNMQMRYTNEHEYFFRHLSQIEIKLINIRPKNKGKWYNITHAITWNGLTVETNYTGRNWLPWPNQ